MKLRILAYGIVSRESSVLIIGGWCDSTDDGSASSLIAKYTLDKWEQVGNLQTIRYAHRAIPNQDKIYVVGGWATRRFVKTEIWSLDNNDDVVNIKVAEPEIEDYVYHPELFLVPSDFCSNN